MGDKRKQMRVNKKAITDTFNEAKDSDLFVCNINSSEPQSHNRAIKELLSFLRKPADFLITAVRK